MISGILIGGPVLAQETTAPAGGTSQLLFLAVMFVAFYFLLIRPQRTRARRQQEMQSAVAVGDRIETIGGIRATVLEVSDDTLLVEIESGTMRIAKRAVGRRIETD